jgi:hypothetical protein
MEVEMVAKGNKDQYRHGYTSGVKADNQAVWGRETAPNRYGPLKFAKDSPPPPEDRSEPQFRQDQRGPNWQDDTASDWRRGFGKGGIESAEGKPGYVPGFKGKR